MKKEILRIGKLLNKGEQKEIQGGFRFNDGCSSFDPCNPITGGGCPFGEECFVDLHGPYCKCV